MAHFSVHLNPNELNESFSALHPFAGRLLSETGLALMSLFKKI